MLHSLRGVVYYPAFFFKARHCGSHLLSCAVRVSWEEGCFDLLSFAYVSQAKRPSSPATLLDWPKLASWTDLSSR